MEEWIGSSAWMARAKSADVPKEWLAGSREPSFPMRHPDQDSLQIIQILDADMTGIVGKALPCRLEEVPHDELELDCQEPVINCIVEYENFDPAGAERLTTAASIRAVEALVGDKGEWRYSLRLSELIYVSDGQILGTVWIGPEALLH